ncbi:MAG: SDR family NAD(P)-dependent oxidoreductase [Bacteroidetes bacterium]|nr:SDR family NAD(P)-dependent oxidoreductase [Bacteroidota bacterium]
MIGRTVIITGASSGVGKALAERVASKKAKLIMFCRDGKKAEAAREEIIRVSHNEDIHIVVGDLSSMKSVRTAAEEIKKKFPEIRLLVNNAGASYTRKIITEEGLEKTFAGNYIGHYMLTLLLLDLMAESEPARIINVASQAHMKIDFENLNGEKRYKMFDAYRYSKAANILFTLNLAERMKSTQVTVNAVHPGVVKTAVYRDIGGFQNLAIKMMWLFFITPEKSADMIMPMLISDSFRNISGKYFVKGKAAIPKPGTDNETDREKLRRLSEKLTGLKL